MSLEFKSNRFKIFIIVLVTILFVVVFSILGIQLAKKYQAQKMAQKRTNHQLNNASTSSQTTEKKKTKLKEAKIEAVNTKLPVYSEAAKTRMKNIYKSDKKIVYLTFDDGPSQAVTPLILDVLKRENIKATFFVLGSRVKQNPEILKREYEEGHYIANHGYTHNYAKIYANSNNALEEYKKTEKEIQKALKNEKYSSHLFRFPGGYYGGKYAKIKKDAAKILNNHQISYIDWNCLTKDAEGANTKEKILENVKKYSVDKNVIILLMHDASTKILTYETLSDVIEFYRKQGYQFDNFYSIMKE